MSVATISFNFQNARGTLAEIPTLLDGQLYWSEDSAQLFIGTAASGNLAITGSTGVFPISITKVSHQWLDSYDDTTGLFTQSQPGFSDLSGSIATGQIPSATITIAQINATGSPSSSTFLRGDGAWATPSGGGSVTSVFGRTGVVTAQSGDYTVSEVTGAAPTASPTFTGTVTAPTVDVTTNLELDGTLTDGSSSVGSSGQVLSSTGTKTQWINPPAVGIQIATFTISAANLILSDPSNPSYTPVTLVTPGASQVVILNSLAFSYTGGTNGWQGATGQVGYNESGEVIFAPSGGLFPPSGGNLLRDGSTPITVFVPPVASSYDATGACVGQTYVFSAEGVYNTGPILTAQVTSGNGGTMYAPGDQFSVNTGDDSNTCTVDTVDGSGAVLTFTINSGGQGNQVSTGNGTTVESGSGDGNLEVDILTVGQPNGTATLTLTYYLITT
jgi:hypothetical protein